MIPDLSKSIAKLCFFVKKALDTSSFVSNLQKADSLAKDGRLYWNLGHSQGYAIIDPMAKKVYRVFDLEESLSANQLCDPATAELVLEDLLIFLEASTDITVIILQDLLSRRSNYGRHPKPFSSPF